MAGPPTGSAVRVERTGPVTAQQAHHIGLANRLVPAGTARAEAEALAAELAADTAAGVERFRAGEGRPGSFG